MLLGVINFVLDTARARSIVQELLAALPAGSYLALTHPTLELGGEGNAEAMRFWNENATPPITARSAAEITTFLGILNILEPGLVSCTRWRVGGDQPADGPFTAPELPQYGVVARKRWSQENADSLPPRHAETGISQDGGGIFTRTRDVFHPGEESTK